MSTRMTRREMLRYVGLGSAAAVLAACAPKVVKETVIVAGTPKVVEKVVKETVIVEKVVEPAPFTGTPIELELFSHHQIEQEPFLRQALDIFAQKHPEYKVKFVNNPDYKQVILTRAASKTLPDTFLIDSPTIPGWREKGIIENITDLVERDWDEVNPDDFWEAQMPEFKLRKDGSWSGLPYDFSNVAFAVNMDLLEEAGLGYPSEDWTWGDIAEMGKTLTKKKGDEITQWGVNGLPRGWWTDAFLKAEGAALLNDEWNRCIINSPEAAEALQLWADMYLEDKVVCDPFARAESTQLFYSGMISIQMCGSWSTLPYRDNIGDRFKWDTQMLPIGVKTGKRAVVAGGACWVMSAGSKHRDDSWELLKYLASQEAVDIYISRLIRSIPGRKSSAFGAWLETAKMGNLDPEHVEIFLTSMDYAELIPQVPFDKELADIQNNYLDQIYMGKAKAAEVLPAWEKEANEAIAKYD